MSNLRKNAWKEGEGTFANLDLLWYAKGVGVLQSRALDDKNSWWFFAAIHGEEITRRGRNTWGNIQAPPSVPTEPLPSPTDRGVYWNQCQHGTWFFAPWHRGYLIALEEQIREAIVGLGGPSNWALPYWNYLGPGNEYKIPPAFMERNLPDGGPNPLYVNTRLGPTQNGDIYIPTEEHPVSGLTPVNQKNQSVETYTNHYGGNRTVNFTHGGSFIADSLENMPHNYVHVYVGGLMGDPGSAALDPIFYLHHCNIDRLWASWNASGKSNPSDPEWLNGPVITGDRKFIMPTPTNSAWVFTPGEVDNLDKVGYSYDDLSSATSPAPVSFVALRLQKLGVDKDKIAAGMNVRAREPQSELVGASGNTLKLGDKGLQASIKLDGKSWKNVPNSLMRVSATNIPDRVYLQLENVKGNNDVNFLSVSVNNQAAGHVPLFGLRSASDKDGHHGGNGLTFKMEITDVIDNLHLDGSLDINALDVSVTTDYRIPEGDEITVGRISVYREH